MAKTEAPALSPGEQRHRQRRRAFWAYSVAGLAVALPVGMCIGYLLRQGVDGVYSPAAALIAMAIATAAFVWFSIGYYRRLDELDLADNLWGAFIAVHVLLVGFPTWAMLHILELTPAPSAEGLYFGTIGATFLGYGWRKLRNR